MSTRTSTSSLDPPLSDNPVRHTCISVCGRISDTYRHLSDFTLNDSRVSYRRASNTHLSIFARTMRFSKSGHENLLLWALKIYTVLYCIWRDSLSCSYVRHWFWPWPWRSEATKFRPWPCFWRSWTCFGLGRCCKTRRVHQRQHLTMTVHH